MEKLSRVDRIIHLVNYSILNYDKDALISVIPSNLSSIEVAQLLVSIYSKAIDETVSEIKLGMNQTV